MVLGGSVAKGTDMCGDGSDVDVVLLQPAIVADSRESWAQAPPDGILRLARQAGSEMFPRTALSADDHARMSKNNFEQLTREPPRHPK